MRFSIVRNDYEQSKILENTIKSKATDKKWIYDEQKPELVFVIGGDGTFLEAISKYNHNLDNIKFYPILNGGIGFYTNHIKFSELPCDLFNIDTCLTEQFCLLEINIDGKVFYSINETKIVSEKRPIHLDVLVGDELLEYFSGTGLVFSTPSGSTGFMKSSHGAIIYPSSGLFEMNELSPVSTVLIQTIDAPIIFDKQTIEATKSIDHEDGSIIIDSKIEIDNFKKVTIKLSDKKATVIRNKEMDSKTKLLNDIFVTNNKVNK